MDSMDSTAFIDLTPLQREVLLNVARSVIRRVLAGEDPLAPDALLPPAPGSVLPPPGAMALDGMLVGGAPAGLVPGAEPLRPESFAPPHAETDPLSEPALRQPAGCFVSLHALQTHRLRGCVGRLDANQPLLDALRATAVNVLDDPRFLNCPVCLEEVPQLQLEISVVSPLRPVAHPLDFEPLQHGIYLTLGKRSGCFLPQVARETGWGREQLLDRLCTEKMGLPASSWRGPGARLSVFSTITIGPEPFVPTGSMSGERM